MARVKLGLHLGSGRIYSGPTLVVLDRGYFKEQGLDIDIVDAGGRRDVFPLFESGELDVCPQGMSLEYVQAFEPERPLIMAADHGSAGGGAGGIVARPQLIDSGRLRDFADLKGLRIGVSPIRGDHDWRTFGAALKKGGLSFDDVEVVICDFGGGRHQALAEGRLDLTTVGRPSSIVEGRETGAFVVWKRGSEVEPGPHQGRTVMMNYPFWSERPDDARRYLVAHLQAVRDYHNAYVHDIDRDAMVDLIARQCGELRTTVEASAPTPLNPDGYVDARSIEEDLDWYAEQGVLPKQVPVDRVVNHSFLEQALAEVGRYSPPAAVR
jgi:NitT/TauT family transport system substrate-binding protein